ncbi:hypothetical protein BJ138DRAFT_1183231 [Hygrophoropsis aurantiaca]|uniref:Uncharacterized protein n=1 Tax=Hygrophoropsis aurantiaca TaxID=72124 RepID=A0ACB8A0U5_9AGAM|nr:hypothetical protein BJ138DRAFT_1183231 [Hygrophoropsis aurantiaca]
MRTTGFDDCGPTLWLRTLQPSRAPPIMSTYCWRDFDSTFDWETFARGFVVAAGFETIVRGHAIDPTTSGHLPLTAPEFDVEIAISEGPEHRVHQRLPSTMNSDSEIAVDRNLTYQTQLLARKYRENLPSVTQQTLAYCQARVRAAIDTITSEGCWGDNNAPIAILGIYQNNLLRESDIVARAVLHAVERQDPIIIPNYLLAFCKVIDRWRDRRLFWRTAEELALEAADAANPDYQARAARRKFLFSDLATVRIDHEWSTDFAHPASPQHSLATAPLQLLHHSSGLWLFSDPMRTAGFDDHGPTLWLRTLQPSRAPPITSTYCWRDFDSTFDWETFMRYKHANEMRALRSRRSGHLPLTAPEFDVEIVISEGPKHRAHHRVGRGGSKVRVGCGSGRSSPPWEATCNSDIEVLEGPPPTWSVRPRSHRSAAAITAEDGDVEFIDADSSMGSPESSPIPRPPSMASIMAAVQAAAPLPPTARPPTMRSVMAAVQASTQAAAPPPAAARPSSMSSVMAAVQASTAPRLVVPAVQAPSAGPPPAPLAAQDLASPVGDTPSLLPNFYDSDRGPSPDILQTRYEGRTVADILEELGMTVPPPTARAMSSYNNYMSYMSYMSYNSY